MIRAVFLDSGPLGLATQHRGIPLADACTLWVDSLTRSGIRVVVPEVTDFEVRRELLRAGRTAGLNRLEAFITAWPDRYLPIHTLAMRRAAELWADARNLGVPTADNRALDGDVILAAQTLTAGYAPDEIMIATTNIRHISRYVACDLWENIIP